MRYHTKLGDVVTARFDDDGNEHITVETVPWANADFAQLEQRVAAFMELVPEPSGLDAVFKHANRRRL